MRYFTEKKKSFLSSEQIERAKKFAEDVAGTVNYSDSNQFTSNKIKDDHFISKVGEEAVYNVFIEFTRDISKPDYSIYQSKEKSWDADLLIDGNAFAVKTQKRSSADMYGLSWIFQKSEVRSDPILLNPQAWVCFVECNDNNFFECEVYPPYQVKELTFKEPKLPHLKGKKKAVYAEDLPQLISDKL